MIPLSIILGLASLALIGRSIRRRGDRTDRLVSAAIVCSLGAVAASVVVAGLSAPFSPWDMVRLAPSMALVRGINPYAGEHSGVVLSTMYGPVAILAFVPAALVGDSAVGAILGRWLAFLFAFGPLVACSRVVERSPDRAWRFMVLALGGLAMLLAPALRYSTTFLHADAPALGLTGLACLLASGKRGPGLWAAIACILAILAKQTMLPLPIALFLSAWILGGRAAALRFGWKLVGVGVMLGLVVVLLMDRQTLALNLVKIPGAVPWRGRAPGNLLATTAELFVHSSPMLVAWLVASKFRCVDVIGEERRGYHIFVLASILLAPMAILGRVKQAGDVNSFSPCLYPLLLAVVCRFVTTDLGPQLLGSTGFRPDHWGTDRLYQFGPRPGANSPGYTIPPRSGLSMSGPERRVPYQPGRDVGAKIALAATLSVATLIASIRLNQDVRLLAIERPFRSETDYLAAHPNSVYFPWNPSAHLAVEGRPTHHLFSAWERGVAGFPMGQAHLLSALPVGCRYVAFPLKRLGPTVGFGSCVQMLERSGLLDRDPSPVRLAGLPDYECYEIAR